MKAIDKPKKHKPNLNGPYSVEPKKKQIDDRTSDGVEKKIEEDKKKKDPAVIDRQE